MESATESRQVDDHAQRAPGAEAEKIGSSFRGTVLDESNGLEKWEFDELVAGRDAGQDTFKW